MCQTDWRLIWAISTGIAIAGGIALGYLLEQPIMAWRASLLKRLKSTRSFARAQPGRVAGLGRAPVSAHDRRTLVMTLLGLLHEFRPVPSGPAARPRRPAGRATATG